MRKSIPGFPGYEADEDGSIWSEWKKTSAGYHKGTVSYQSGEFHRIKPIERKKDGRLVVNLRGSDGKVKRSLFVHHLILITFVGPCPKGMEACHWDGDPKNNAVTNLRWDTKKSNYADRVRHGRDHVGSKHPMAVIDEDVARLILRLTRDGYGPSRIAKTLGLRLSCVEDVKYRRSWRHVDAGLPVDGQAEAVQG